MTNPTPQDPGVATIGDRAPLRLAVAAEVRAELARQRVSVNILADRVGMPRASMHRRCRGEIDFGVEELDKVARALGVPFEALAQGIARGGDQPPERN